MIRQRNIEARSTVGMNVWHFAPIAWGAIAAAVARGIAIPQVAKVQLIDLTILTDVVIVGGGTLQADLYKLASNVAALNAGVGTLVKAGPTGLSAVGATVFDLRNVAPIDPTNPLLLAATPNDFLLQVRLTNTGTVTTVTLGWTLRYRAFDKNTDS